MTGEWRIRWPDGHWSVAPTAAAMLDRIAADSFGSSDLLSIRTALVRRAEAWSGAQISPHLAADELLRALAAAGLFCIESAPR